MQKNTPSPVQNKVNSLVGMCIFGVLITGVASLFTALLAVANESDYTGAGLALLAAAVAFGLLANAILRT